MTPRKSSWGMSAGSFLYGRGEHRTALAGSYHLVDAALGAVILGLIRQLLPLGSSLALGALLQVSIIAQGASQAAGGGGPPGCRNALSRHISLGSSGHILN